MNHPEPEAEDLLAVIAAEVAKNVGGRPSKGQMAIQAAELFNKEKPTQKFAPVSKDERAAATAAAAAIAAAIADATAKGYRPLTTPYFASEIWMLNSVERDMQRGGISYILIKVGPGLTEVWRHGGIESVDHTRSVAKGIRGGQE